MCVDFFYFFLAFSLPVFLSLCHSLFFFPFLITVFAVLRETQFYLAVTSLLLFCREREKKERKKEGKRKRSCWLREWQKSRRRCELIYTCLLFSRETMNGIDCKRVSNQLAHSHAPFITRNVRKLFADSFHREKVNEEFVERFWCGVFLERAKQLPDWSVASPHLFCI